MKDRVGMSERVEVSKRFSNPCERCGGALEKRENGVVCISCRGIHEYANGRWVYAGRADDVVVDEQPTRKQVGLRGGGR